MSETLAELVEAKLTSKDLDLPVYNPVAAELQKLLGEPNFNMDRVAALLQKDPTLTGQLLRVANSPFFGGLGEVKNVHDAVIRLGVKQVSNLVTLVTQKQNFHVSDPRIDSYLKRLWDHSVAVGGGASWLATRLGYRPRAPEAFLAGLLHDFGMLFLLRVLADMAKESPVEVTDALIYEILFKMHAEQGDRLMREWNLPEAYREVARLHHSDGSQTVPVLVNIVRLADLVASKLGVGIEPVDEGFALAATAPALALGAVEVLLAELEIAIEDGIGVAAL